MTSTTYVQEIKLTITTDDLQLISDIRANAYGDLDTLIRSGVFSFKNGVAELHRDSKGKLNAVTIKQWTYKV